MFDPTRFQRQLAHGVLLAVFATFATLLPLSASAQTDKTFTNSIGTEFILIPAGSFTMGADKNAEKASDDETPLHLVSISQAFYLGKYPVTQEQWEAVMGSNPSQFKGRNNPVEEVSWDDVQTFIQRLNAKEGTKKYRLPTEAEWEYAARAGTKSAYSFGDDAEKPGDGAEKAGDDAKQLGGDAEQSGDDAAQLRDGAEQLGDGAEQLKDDAEQLKDGAEQLKDDAEQLGAYAWYYDNSVRQTHPVGQKKPNPWGLYDMHGNVWEWVNDWYDKSYYSRSPSTDPAGPASGQRRVLRGGSWNLHAEHLRSANRGSGTPGLRYDGFGFRLACSTGQ
ncbi:hypothetical protein AGMMS50243_28630 [Betaproteobacteria bacterium]|nr:hypothetical protein AGMMS50243_28630 [Betaproteobacteria bacterium]